MGSRILRQIVIAFWLGYMLTIENLHVLPVSRWCGEAMPLEFQLYGRLKPALLEALPERIALNQQACPAAGVIIVLLGSFRQLAVESPGLVDFGI